MGFRTRLISDRQNLKLKTKARLMGLEPWMLDRTDMFWVEYAPPGGSPYGKGGHVWSVDSTSEGGFTLSHQGDSREPQDLRLKAEAFFRKSPARKQMQGWEKDLETE